MSGFIDPSIFPESVHPLVAQLGEFHQKRQWHQLVEALTVLVKTPEASLDKNLIQVRLPTFFSPPTPMPCPLPLALSLAPHHLILPPSLNLPYPALH